MMYTRSSGALAEDTTAGPRATRDKTDFMTTLALGLGDCKTFPKIAVSSAELSVEVGKEKKTLVFLR